MATQIGVIRAYSTVSEKTDTRLKTCVKCKVKAVPRGIGTSGMNGLAPGVQTHCPNCGHIHGEKNH